VVAASATVVSAPGAAVAGVVSAGPVVDDAAVAVLSALEVESTDVSEEDPSSSLHEANEPEAMTSRRREEIRERRTREDGSAPPVARAGPRHAGGRLGCMTTLHWADGRLEIHKVVVGPYENNVFVLRCRETGDAVLIDAANEHGLLLDLAKRLGVRRILETHGHFDHIGAVAAMRDAGYEVAVTSADAPMLKDVGYDVFLDDAEVIEVGKIRLHAIHNPGHTPGSVSFRVEGSPVLFSGDTLFPGGPGNTSFPGGDFPTIISSLDDKLFTLPAETVVMPGHGEDTTIGHERPHLAEWVERGW
jgi:glyoxylase-like metal-dependent hydrolase (beta-lactamase superfamily II)